MATPLTDGINALTAYANEVTGESNTNLSDAVETLAAGYGNYDIQSIIEKVNIAGDIVYDGVNNRGVSLSFTNITSVKYTNVVNINNEYGTFLSCAQLKHVDFPKLTSLANSQTTFYSCKSLKWVYFPVLKTGAIQMFANCSNLLVGIFPKLQNTSNNMFVNCTKFETLDIGETGNGYDSTIGNRVFNGATLKRLILRPSDRRVLLGSTADWDTSTAMQPGGEGVDIYIPKALYDCLGDGSNLDYLALPNWATVDGYGTITWKKIEGSQYEDRDWWKSLLEE